MGGLKEKTGLAIELGRAAEAADAHVKIRYNPKIQAKFVEDSSEMAKYNSGTWNIGHPVSVNGEKVVAVESSETTVDYEHDRYFWVF
jgi:hypothetical protein